MKIHSVGAKFCVDGQTDLTKLIVTFSVVHTCLKWLEYPQRPKTQTEREGAMNITKPVT